MAIIKTKFNRGVEGTTNIVDAGTEGTRVATGTTAQRGSTTGQWRYNTTTGFFEGRSTSGAFLTLEPSPIVTSVDDTEVDSGGGGNQTIVITGTNFTSGSIASFVGTTASFNATATTINSLTQITAVVPKSSFLNAQEPYKVKVTSAQGLAGISASGLINVDNTPTWTTSAGSLGSIAENATGNHFTVAASDPDGDTIAYSLQSGGLAGLSLNSSSGVISGDPTNVSSDTTNSFNLRATAGSKTADRAFSYITTNLVTGSGGIETTYTSGGTAYRSHTFLSNGTFILNETKALDFIIVAGGGAGGKDSEGDGGGGGAGGAIVLTNQSTSTNSYSIVIGNGGVPNSTSSPSTDGQNSTAFSNTAIGGGTGATAHSAGTIAARSGGSGGGGGGESLTAGGIGTSGQGNSGGTGANPSGAGRSGGGGGGAGASGGNASSGTGGVGANGIQNNYRTNSNIYYSGGGGGGSKTNGSLGGSGGGGRGSNATSGNQTSGTVNTGGGGGGGTTGSSGGSGIVVIRYAI